MNLTPRTCEACGKPYEGNSHLCLPTPSPGLEETLRRCAACGQTYTGDSHRDCAAGAGAARKPSSKPPDELPEEVRTAPNDPSFRLKHYLLARQIGKGGMGSVWKAWDTSLSRWTAIKFLSGGSEEEIQRFQREAKVAASVRHPNIASIYEIGEEGGRHFIAMEFIDGLPSDRAKLPLRQAAEVVLKAALAIDAAHKAGIVHRDLKPQNIMVTPQGWPYVLDFGLAKQVSGGQTLSMSGVVMGTPAYMPPEQAQGHISKINALSDVYSLGATLYELVTGQPPFKAETPMSAILKVINEEPVDPSRMISRCPPEISTIILKAMEKEPGRRYASAAELAEDLRRFLNDEPLVARPPSFAYLLVKNVRRNKLAWLLAITVAAAAAVVGTLVFQKPPAATSEVEAFRTEWEKAFKPLEFHAYRPGAAPAEPFEPAYVKLAALPPEQAARCAEEFEREARAAENTLKAWRDNKADWLAHREEIARIVSWTRDASRAIESAPGKEAFAAPLRKIRTLGEEAARMAAYRGSVTLLVHVAPWGRVRSLASGTLAPVRDGRIVPGADVRAAGDDLTTPLSLSNLEIRDWELGLEDPQGGTRTVRIAADTLQNAREYVLSGNLSRPESLTLKPAK